jgi:hypothetical protein
MKRIFMSVALVVAAVEEANDGSGKGEWCWWKKRMDGSGSEGENYALERQSRLEARI